MDAFFRQEQKLLQYFLKNRVLLIFISILYSRFVWADLALPVYPEDPTHQALATYYQALSAYYTQEAKLDAAKAAVQTQLAYANGAKTSDIKKARPFDGSNVGLGLVMNTGNTTTRNFNGTSLVSYVPNAASTTTLNTTYQYVNSNQDGTTTNKFYTDLNSAYNFDLKNGLFGDLNYTRDISSGYIYQVNESVGYNRTLYQNPVFSLTSQVGPGLQQSEIQSSGQFQNQVSANLNLFSVYNFSNQTLWRETFGITATDSNIDNTLDSTLSFTIFKQFALQLDYLVTYDTSPLPTKTNLNTTATVALVYNY